MVEQNHIKPRTLMTCFLNQTWNRLPLDFMFSEMFREGKSIQTDLGLKNLHF